VIALAPLAADLGVGFIAIRSRTWKSRTFTGYRFEIATDADLPTDLDVREFPSLSGCIVADAAAVNSRTLELLLVEAD
jgi:hypothetical protein